MHAAEVYILTCIGMLVFLLLMNGTFWVLR
jgi:hypothetical protein